MIITIFGRHIHIFCLLLFYKTTPLFPWYHSPFGISRNNPLFPWYHSPFIKGELRPFTPHFILYSLSFLPLYFPLTKGGASNWKGVVSKNTPVPAVGYELFCQIADYWLLSPACKWYCFIFTIRSIIDMILITFNF